MSKPAQELQELAAQLHRKLSNQTLGVIRARLPLLVLEAQMTLRHCIRYNRL